MPIWWRIKGCTTAAVLACLFLYWSIYSLLETFSNLAILGDIFFILFSIILPFLFAICCLYFAFFHYRFNEQFYEKLCKTYPELEWNFHLLFENARFHQKRLKIVVYQDHIIVYYNQLLMVDLRKMTYIHHYIFSKRYWIFSTITSSINVMIDDNEQFEVMPIKHLRLGLDKQVLQLYNFLSQEYPAIKIGKTSRERNK